MTLLQLPPDAPTRPTAPPPPQAPKRRRPAPAPAPHNPFARAFDPFEQLEERDWKHVVSDVLQVVDFLSRNEFLKGVERRAGEMDEESGIEVLAEGSNQEDEKKAMPERDVPADDAKQDGAEATAGETHEVAPDSGEV